MFVKLNMKLSVLAALVVGFVTSAHAWNYTASGQWATFNFGNWTVYADEWGSSSYAELYANNAGNFACAGSWTGGGTKNYASTQSDVDVPISSSYYCNSSFNFSAPNNPWWSFFYDVWTANNQDELMIQEGWFDDGGNHGWGTEISANVTIGGKLIKSVSQANNGANNVLIFTPANQQSSGSEDIMAYFIWASNRGLLHNSTLHHLCFGVEVTYTSGWQQFTVNSFSANWGQNSSGLGNGTYKLIARHSGKAMDANGYGTANGTQIQQWSYTSGANQKWTVTDTGGGNYKIIGVHSGKAIDINNWGTGNGTKVQLWDYSGGSNQTFKFSGTDSGNYRITPNSATGSCLDVNGYSTADGAVVQLWQWTGGNNQQWSFQAP
jgi:hypothetical protein